MNGVSTSLESLAKRLDDEGPDDPDGRLLGAYGPHYGRGFVDGCRHAAALIRELVAEREERPTSPDLTAEGR